MKAAEEARLCLTTTDPVIAPATKRRRLLRLGDVDTADADPSLVVAASSADADVEELVLCFDYLLCALYCSVV